MAVRFLADVTGDTNLSGSRADIVGFGASGVIVSQSHDWLVV
jgi:hypothetical protein